MKKIILTICAAMSVFNLSTSWATCDYYNDLGRTCHTWNPGAKDNCGTGCTYTYDSASKTVYVSATGDNATMSASAFSSGGYEDNAIGVDIKNIVIDGKIKLSTHALYNGNYQITGADGTLTLTGIGWHSLGGSTINSDIIIPEGSNLSTIALYNIKMNGKIYCAIQNCAEVLRNTCLHPDKEVSDRCLLQLEPLLTDPDHFEQAPKGCDILTPTGCKCSEKRVMQEKTCVDSCGASFKLNDGECDRIRYTPAEAAEVLKNDNTNSVTITFKK